ncbi:MAG: beta-lactamase family protein [Myxococcales bacterium]|nr:beta-lactamase family protein [Myxococcales bacterium]
MRYVIGFAGIAAPVLLCVLLGAAVPGCSETTGANNWAPCDYESNPASAKYDFNSVDSTVEEFLADYPAVNGVTLAIVQRSDGQVYENGYGELDPGRISMLASTSKVLSVGIILALVDEGLLDLDRPIAEYLDWGDHHPGVTMRQMLSMMSGLPPLIPGVGRCTPTACECDPAANMRECARTVFQNEAASIPPGTVWLYGRWQLAGAVAEIVSNKSWAQLVREKLVEPCGLPSTGYKSDTFTAYPEEFGGDPASLPETDNPGVAGGAYSNVCDYSKVLLMHLRGGLCEQVRVLSPAMVQAMQEDLVPEGVSMLTTRAGVVNYGMGWWKFEGDLEGLLIDSGAWGARAFLHPEEHWGAIFIMEADSDDGHELLERVVPVVRAAVIEADRRL